MIRIKQTAAPPPNGDPLEFVMSDGSVDRMGDVIEPDGWRLDNFRKNPVALFSHDASFPVGKWSEVTIKGDRLVGRLDLLEPVSDRQREIRAAGDAGVLRVCRVGFHATKYEPLEGSKNGGLHFTEQELVECSLVSVPANPNALAVAKQLGISREGQQLIFGVPAEPDQSRQTRGPIGVPAGTDTSFRKHKPMNSLSERIQGAQTQIVALQDELQKLIDGDDVDKSGEVAERIEQARNQLAAWERAEKALGSGSSEPMSLLPARPTGVPAAVPTAQQPKAWAMPKKQEEPGHLFLRHMVAV